MDIKVLEISDKLSQIGLSVRERLQALSENIAEYLRKRCCIYVVEENKNKHFSLIAGYPLEFHGIGKSFSFTEHLPLKKVLEEKNPLLIEDIKKNPLLNEEQKKWSQGAETISILFVPIIFSQEVLGVIVLDIAGKEEISKKEISFVQQIASHIAWAVNNAQAYEKLEKKEEELAKAVRLATLGEEWLKLAHELRNPLTTLGGYARRLLDSFPDNDSRKEKTEIIIEETEKMEECLKNHLEFVQGDSPPLIPQHLNSLILESLTDFERESNFPRERIKTEFSERSTLVLADSFQMKKVFINILKNAQEAIGEEIIEDSFILVKTWREDNFVRVEISNSSHGRRIPEEVLDRLFSPFFTTKKEGVGLGLSVVYQILDLHDAEIYCQSDEGKTSFLMKFPSTL